MAVRNVRSSLFLPVSAFSSWSRRCLPQHGIGRCGSQAGGLCLATEFESITRALLPMPANMDIDVLAYTTFGDAYFGPSPEATAPRGKQLGADDFPALHEWHR